MLTTTGEGRLLSAFVSSEGPFTVGLQDQQGELHGPGYSRQPYGDGQPSFGPALKQPWRVTGVMLFSHDDTTLDVEPIPMTVVRPGQGFRVQIEWAE